ncbi:MAG: hypothetical protein V4710_23535 [Verrucomicrobiota bacterium]
MEREGPPLESLTRRLAETPPDFLDEPRIGSSGLIHVGAVVNDLIGLLGGEALPGALSSFLEAADPRTGRNRLGITLLLCWLLSDEWFRKAKPAPVHLITLLGLHASELAAQTAPLKFVHDPDRREELARMALARLGFRPAGETVAQAQDRLTSLSSVERARVMGAARVAEERARAVREALARKAAEESADKYTRE